MGWNKSYEECESLRDYSEEVATQCTHKEAWSGGKEKRGKLEKFIKEDEEMNSMDGSTAHDKRGKKCAKTAKNESNDAELVEDYRVYGFDHINLSKSEYEMQSSDEW